ncbi:uncharacterized protein RSE6_02309 [Rhynchosporium secalis]|uniref:Uncharacterized protein n=1 Tax=Rhynchosporium secalis TaxID=38038 RepID=A0A1E1LZW9_RHYSE|nr:uncharacterized protein RSE6_02309 [Rhynchosporium secalis]
MCHIYNFPVCGHIDIDTSSCTNSDRLRFPCKPLFTNVKLVGECSRCRESFLRTVAKRSSVATREATCAELSSFETPPTLFAWPKNSARRQTKQPRSGPLRDGHLEGIPESPTIVKEERSRNVGSEKPLPRLPTPTDTVRNFSPAAFAYRASAQAHPTTHPRPGVVSTAHQTTTIPASLTTTIPQNNRKFSPAPSQSQNTVSLLPRKVIATQQQSPKAHPANHCPPPAPAARLQPGLDRKGHRLKGRDFSARLRDVYKATEEFHPPAGVPPSVSSKTQRPYPAWTTLPSQIEERTREAGQVWRKTQTEWDQREPRHTPSKELFLTTPAEEEVSIHLDQGEFPSCLQPANHSQAHDLSRLSANFNLYTETGGESSIERETRDPVTTASRTYTTYSGVPAVEESASEIPLRSYAAHAARKAEAVEFETRKATATPTPTAYFAYNPIFTMKDISQFSARMPIEFETVASSRDRALASEKSLFELSANFNMTSGEERKSIELVNANSDSGPSSAYAPTTTLNQVKSLPELSAVFDLEAQIELESHSRLTTLIPTQHNRLPARLSTVGEYECYNPQTVTLTAEPSSELPETPIKASKLSYKLPNLKRHSAMKLDGNGLEGVFQTWA